MTTGVLTKQFGAIDETVEVGADLCEIDTEAVATVEATEVVAAAPEADASAPSPAPVEAPSTPVLSSSGSSQARTPSINFLGKEGWEKKLTVEPEYVIPANYGRLLFSEEEMEALLMVCNSPKLCVSILFHWYHIGLVNFFFSGNFPSCSTVSLCQL